MIVNSQMPGQYGQVLSPGFQGQQIQGNDLSQFQNQKNNQNFHQQSQFNSQVGSQPQNTQISNQTGLQDPQSLSAVQPDSNPDSKQSSPMELNNLLQVIKNGDTQLKEEHKKILQQGFSLIFEPKNTIEFSRLKNTHLRLGIFKFASFEQENLAEKFWLAILTNFISKHPYCSFQGVKQFLRIHQILNKQLYGVKYGQQDFFNFFALSQGFHADGSPNTESLLFRKICSELSNSIGYFCINLTKCYSLIKANVAREIFKADSLHDIFTSFTVLYNSDFIHLNPIRYTFSNFVFTSLVNLYELNLKAFDRDFMRSVISYFDSNLYLIQQGNNKELGKSLRRKCIKFVNDLLFKFPCTSSDWDPQTIKLIHAIQSKELHPLKWCLPTKEASRDYFLIQGREWLGLFDILSHRSKNEPRKADTVFYLACSLICDGLPQFWSESQEYLGVYRYVASLVQKFAENTEDAGLLGKVCRLLICLFGANGTIEGKRPQSKGHPPPSPRAQLKWSQNCQLARIITHKYLEKLSDGKIGIIQFLTEILLQKVILNPSIDLQALFTASYIPQAGNSAFHALQRQYNYQLEGVSYEFVVKLLIHYPELLEIIVSLWPVSKEQRDSKCNNERGTFSSVPSEQDLIFSLTIGYALRVEKRDNLEQISNFHVFPHTLMLLNQLLQRKQTSEHCLNMLAKRPPLHSSQIRNMLSRTLVRGDNMSALMGHLEVLLELGLFESDWVSNFCLPGLESMEDCSFAKMADFMTIYISRKFFREKGDGYNIPSLKNTAEQASDFSYKSGQKWAQIQFLSQYCSRMVAYLKLSLRVEEDCLNEFVFYNMLFMQKKYHELYSVLSLLEVLAVLYIQWGHQIQLPEELSRFLEVFSTSQGHAEALAGTITISSNRYVTLPAALVYLLSSSTTTTTTAITSDEGSQSAIISMTINLISLYLSQGDKQKNNMNMDIYTKISNQNITDGHASQKLYCCGYEKLLEYLTGQIYASRSPQPSKQDNEHPHRISHHYGDILNLMTLLLENTAIDEQQVHGFVQNRLVWANQQLSRSNNDNMGISDREMLGFGRYAEYLCKHGRAASTGQDVSGLVMVCVVRLWQEIESAEKSDLFEELGSVVWSILGSMHPWAANTGKDPASIGSSFVKIVKNNLPYILHPSHLSITTPKYLREYRQVFFLIMSAREYLSARDYQTIFCSDSALSLLRRFMMTELPSTDPYMLLLYALRVYVHGRGYLAISHHTMAQELRQVEKIIKEKLTQRGNYGSTQLETAKLYHQVGLNDGLFSLLFFFKTHIPPNHRLLPEDTHFDHTLLISSCEITSGINFKVLLLNTIDYHSTDVLQAVNMVKQHPHELEFISICNFFYKKIMRGGCSKNQLICMIGYLSGVLRQSLGDKKDSKGVRFALLSKIWGCNLLNLMVQKSCNQDIVLRVSALVFQKTCLMAFFGGLLQLFTHRGVSEGFAAYDLSVLSLGGCMGLDGKSLLLAIMKLLSSLMVFSSHWAALYESVYVELCQSLVELTPFFCPEKTISKSSRLGHGHGYTSSQGHDEVEKWLQKMSLKQLYSLMSSSRQNQHSESIPSKHHLQIDQLPYLHPGCANALDIFHQHYNTLIAQQFINLLYCAYQPSVTNSGSLQYESLCKILEQYVARLGDAMKNGDYMRAMRQLDQRIWYGHRMSVSRGYTNYLESSLSEAMESMEEIVEVGEECLKKLEGFLHVHKEYHIFMQKSATAREILDRYRVSRARKMGQDVANSDVGPRTPFNGFFSC